MTARTFAGLLLFLVVVIEAVSGICQWVMR